MKIGKALIALLAIITGLAVSSGSAAAAAFHSDSTFGNTVLTGTQTNTFSTDVAGNKFTCEKGSYAGTMTGNTAAAIRLEASYTGCTFFGVAVSWAMNNCRYELSANGDVAIVDKEGVDCNSSKITFKATFLGISCHITIGEQTGLKSIAYDGSKTEENGSITLTPFITGLAYTAEGAGCGETGSKTNGFITSGTTTLRGYADHGGCLAASVQTPIWVA